MFFYPLGFCEDHINNSSKVPSPSACHIHGCSIHFDSFSFFWIQELLGGGKKHLGREHDWEGVGLSYFTEHSCMRREDSRMAKPHSSSGLLPRIELTRKSILKPGHSEGHMNPSVGLSKHRSLCLPPSISGSGSRDGAWGSALLTSSQGMLMLPAWDHTELPESPSHNSEVLCKLSLDFP